MKRVLWMAAITLVLGLLALGCRLPAQAQDAPTDAGDIVSLGKAIFFDADLSSNGTQACATCHDSTVGFTGPDAAINTAGAVYEGALPNHFGNRKPPAAAYAGDSPALYFDEAENAWFGGMFWDGRATGASLGDPLAEQAQGPFLNPLEQAVADAQDLCVKVNGASYAGLFEQVWGAGSLDCAEDANGVYERIARSIAAYERSTEVSPFSSKFDLFWDKAQSAGKDVTQIKCGTVGGAMAAVVWAVRASWAVGAPWAAPAARILATGRPTATWDLAIPNSKDWQSSTIRIERTAQHATRLNLVLRGIPSSPTSAMKIPAYRRTQAIRSTQLPPNGITTARIGWTLGWGAF